MDQYHTQYQNTDIDGIEIEIGIPDHLTCPLRNLYAGQEATVRTGQGTTDCFQIEKGVCQGCILSPCLFNLYAEYIMRNAGLEEAQAEIKGRLYLHRIFGAPPLCISLVYSICHANPLPL